MENASLFCHYCTIAHLVSQSQQKEMDEESICLHLPTAGRTRQHSSRDRIFAQQPNRPTTRTVSVRHPAVTCNWDKVGTQRHYSRCQAAALQHRCTSTEAAPCSHPRHFLKTPTAIPRRPHLTDTLAGCFQIIFGDNCLLHISPETNPRMAIGTLAVHQ